jgi:hypothetical protein
VDANNVFSSNFNENNEFNVGDRSFVNVEVDLQKKRIYYFINKKQCPYYSNSVSSSPLLFGISAYYSN